MLPKKQRLKKELDFKRVFRKGIIVRGILMDLRIIKNELGARRFGFVVSLKAAGKAVTRNRIRRYLAQAAKDCLGGISGGYDIAVIAKPLIINKSLSEISGDFRSILKKSKIFND